MEANRARYRDDNPGLPSLSLGVSSVRHIVTKLEARYARAAADASQKQLVKYNPEADFYGYSDLPLVLSRGQVLNRLLANFGVALQQCVPSVTFTNFGVLSIASGLVAPKMLSYLVIYPFCRLVFGTLYPAYASYKAVRTKNLKEYVKWMMYWIVFALFTCTETFTDVFLSWFPFYYEVKIVLVLWLLSPATKGSSFLYRKFVHPALCRREQEIDEYIAKAKDQGYHTVLNLGTKGVNYATTVIMQTAIKGGGGLVQQLRKSYSLSDLTECEPREELAADEADDVMSEPRLIRRAIKSAYTTRRSASESNSRQPLYFPEVDVDVRGPRPRLDEPDFSHIKSTEDISSGYSSADNSAPLARTASVGGRARRSARTVAVTSIKRPPPAEDDEVIIEELHEDDSYDSTMPQLLSISSPLYISHTTPPFIYQYVGDKVKIIQVLGSPNIREQSVASDINDIIVTTEPDKDEKYVEHSNIPNTNLSLNSENNSTEETACPILEKSNVKTTNLSQDYVHSGNNYNQEMDESEEFLDTVNESSSDAQNDSAESDDEASFSTPELTPKSVKKALRGRYGKSKAPLPPKQNEIETPLVNSVNNKKEEVNTIDDSDLNTIKSLCVSSPEISKDSLNIEDNNKRAKSKSPVRLPVKSNLGFGKLLQFPSKLAFWAKNDEKSKSDVSISSGNDSRRSSDKIIYDEFASCSDISNLLNERSNDIPDVDIDKNSTNDNNATNENIAQNILNKSDELQRIIDATLDSHPEYKFVPLHAEIETTSKSTDV